VVVVVFGFGRLLDNCGLDCRLGTIMLVRALIVVRLSRVQEGSTSVAKQEEICRDFCRQRGWVVIGVATDTDVSGAVDPFDRKKRPELAAWLAGEREPFDALVAYRADRLTRSVRNLQTLVRFAEDHSFTVTSATEPHFDMSSPFAAVLVALIGMISEWELTAISERNASTRKRDRKLAKYTGSTPPWGWMPVKVNSEWRLVPDPEQVKVIHEVVERVLEREPLLRIANDLTARGVLTVKDRLRQGRGEPVEGTGWSQTVLKRSLISDAMLGVVIADGKPLRSADGAPVTRPDSILTREVFDRVKAELGSRSTAVPRSPAQQSLLTGVLFCGVCGLPAYRFNGGSHSQYPRYRCSSLNKNQSCGNKTTGLAEIDSAVEKLIVSLLGASERKAKQWRAGSDNSVELAEIDAELIEVTGLVGSPAYRAGTPQRVALDARIEALAARQEQLSGEVSQPAGWDWVGTGERFGEWWAAQDYAGKNQWMRSMGVRVTFDRAGLGFTFGDLSAVLKELDADALTEQYRGIQEFAAKFGITAYEFNEDGVTLVSSDGERHSFTVDELR
jgi:site-specific DNA recombinase